MTAGVDPPWNLEGVTNKEFTDKQGQYLAFIYAYAEINHSTAPSERDMQAYFQVTPPTIHQMVKKLHANGLIDRTPGQARSIKLLVAPEDLPILRRH